METTTKTPMTTERVWLAISAYTGIFVAEMVDFQNYCQELLNRQIWSHELGKENVMLEIRERSHADFRLAVDFLKTAAGSNEELQELITDVRLEPWSARRQVIELYVALGHNPEIVKVLKKQLKDGSWMD